MNYNELVKTIKHKQRMDDSNIQRFTEICNNYKQVMTAFELSCKFCNEASYELLSMALGYASPDSINEVISQAENLTDPDSRDAIVADAIEFYDSEMLSSIRNIIYGTAVPDYGIGTIVRAYNQSPNGSSSKEFAIDWVETVFKSLLEIPYDRTKCRLKNIAKLNSNDQSILSIKAKAEQMIADGDFR